MGIRGEVPAEEGSGASGEEGSASAAAAAAAPRPQNIVYVIHPNCAIEEV